MTKKVVRGDDALGGPNDPGHLPAVGQALPGDPPVDSLPADADRLSEVADALLPDLKVPLQSHLSRMSRNARHVKRDLSRNLYVTQKRGLRYSRRMTWLSRIISEKGMRQADLARASQAPRQTISRLVSGEIKMSKDWADRLGPILGVHPTTLLYGPEAAGTPGASIEALEIGIVPGMDDEPDPWSVQVVGEVAAGRWFSYEDLDASQFPPVPRMPGRYGRVRQFAYRVSGQSLNKLRINDGDFIICVPFDEVRSFPQTDDVVVVERREGTLTERTAKQVVVKDDRYELWPRSSIETYKEPIVILKTTLDAHENDATEIKLVGLAIGRFAPITGI